MRAKDAVALVTVPATYSGCWGLRRLRFGKVTIVPRRVLRLLICLVLLSLGAAACSAHTEGSPTPDPGWVSGSPQPPNGDSPVSAAPNIVFVLTDDLSWNLVKYMPHVLAMERAGVTFDQNFVTDSLCCPSRTSILTGQFPHTDGVYSNADQNGGFHAFLAHHDQSKTFAPILQARGYVSGMFGKFLNEYAPEHTYSGQRPYIPPGWAAWDVADRHGYDEYGYRLSVGHAVASYGSAPRDYLTSVLSDKASQFIADSAAAHRPFLAEISTFAPHEPFVPAPADVHKFPDLKAPQSPAFGKAVVNAPPWLSKIPPLTTRARNVINRQFALRVRDVQSVDRMIGRLQTELETLGIAQNTYVVFTSDNGLHLGEHNLRQGKQTAFDTDIKVPLIVTGPGVVHGTVRQLTANIDLAPTFETIAGATPPSMVEGHTLIPQLRGQTPGDWRSVVLVEHHGPTLSPTDPDYPGLYSGNPPSYEAIRTATALYVEYSTGRREYYNLTADPYELVNRYDEMSAPLRSRLSGTLHALERCQGYGACWRAQHLTPPPRGPA